MVATTAQGNLACARPLFASGFSVLAVPARPPGVRGLDSGSRARWHAPRRHVWRGEACGRVALETGVLARLDLATNNGARHQHSSRGPLSCPHHRHRATSSTDLVFAATIQRLGGAPRATRCISFGEVNRGKIEPGAPALSLRIHFIRAVLEPIATARSTHLDTSDILMMQGAAESHVVHGPPLTANHFRRSTRQRCRCCPTTFASFLCMPLPWDLSEQPLLMLRPCVCHGHISDITRIEWQHFCDCCTKHRCRLGLRTCVCSSTAACGAEAWSSCQTHGCSSSPCGHRRSRRTSYSSTAALVIVAVVFGPRRNVYESAGFLQGFIAYALQLRGADAWLAPCATTSHLTAFTVSGSLVLVAWILSVCSLVGAESLLSVALDVGGWRRHGEALVYFDSAASR